MMCSLVALHRLAPCLSPGSGEWAICLDWNFALLAMIGGHSPLRVPSWQQYSRVQSPDSENRDQKSNIKNPSAILHASPVGIMRQAS